MTMLYTCLLTTCLLLGFHIRLPVTMFPATVGGVSPHPRGGPELAGYTHRGWTAGWDTNNSIGRFYSNSEDLDARSRINTHIGDQGKRIIGSGLDERPHVNGRTNRAESPGHAEFDNIKDLSGIDPALSTNHIKSLQSDINRITQKLMNIKSQRTNNKTANISANPAKQLHVLSTDQTTTDHGGDTALRYANALTTTHGGDVTTDDRDKQAQHSPIFDEKQLKTANKSNGIVWSSQLTNMCATGFSNDEHFAWKTQLERAQIVKMEEGCGNMQNRMVTFSDSTKACVRYRLNSDLMQGDIYSYYLARLLGIHHIPPTSLHKPDPTQQWLDVSEDITSVKWPAHKTVIITKWIHGLNPVYIPTELKGPDRLLHPHNGLFRKTTRDLCGLVQWTDLIVFDYISANLDRVVNNMFNLKWNKRMMERPIHNLETDASSDRFVFLDNESGLFHGYRLLDTYGPYHKSLLDKVCIFRQSTIDAVEKLYKAGDAGDKLQALYQNNEQLHGYLPRMSHKTTTILQQRIEDVFKHIQLCKHLYSTS